MLPQIAEGDANKVWIVPSEIGKALEGLGSTMNSLKGIPDDVDGPRTRVDMGPELETPEQGDSASLRKAHDDVAAAIAAAQDSSRTGNATTGGATGAAPLPEEPTGQ